MARALGFFLRTAPAARILSIARMAGPRANHPDVTFPICPACRIAASPVFRVDFRASPLDSLALWPDLLVALICHNRCDSAVRDGATCRWWDHGDPLRPTDLYPHAIVTEHEVTRRALDELVENERAEGLDPGFAASVAPGPRFPAEDIEFEEIALSLEPRLTRDPDRIDVSSRVGGEPAWLQRGYRMDDDGNVVGVEPDPPSCPRCAKPTEMLVQWSEGVDIPRRTTRVGRKWRLNHGYVMGNPFVRFWFGCAACKLVGSLAQLD